MKPISLPNALSLPTPEIVERSRRFLVHHYGGEKVFRSSDPKKHEEFLYAVGAHPICLVAHMDTVRDKTYGVKRAGDSKPVELVTNRNVVRNKNGVLGADDRAGVWGIQQIVEFCVNNKIALPSVIFTNGEESGGTGVKCMIGTKIFEQQDKDLTRMFVELDRQGNGEWVTYGGKLPNEVEDYVESFGFRKEHGSYSDISNLQDSYEIPGVNLSVGYYRQHTDMERLHLDELKLTVNRVIGMMRDPISKLYKAKKTSYGSWEGDYDFEKYYSKNRGNHTNTRNTPVVVVPSKTSYNKMTDIGNSVINTLLQTQTYSGYCPECGDLWTNCSCNHMAELFSDKLSDYQLTILLQSYMDEKDKLYPIIKAICPSVTTKGGPPKLKDYVEVLKTVIATGASKGDIGQITRIDGAFFILKIEGKDNTARLLASEFVVITPETSVDTPATKSPCGKVVAIKKLCGGRIRAGEIGEVAHGEQSHGLVYAKFEKETSLYPLLNTEYVTVDDVTKRPSVPRIVKGDVVVAGKFIENSLGVDITAGMVGEVAEVYLANIYVNFCKFNPEVRNRSILCSAKELILMPIEKGNLFKTEYVEKLVGNA